MTRTTDLWLYLIEILHQTTTRLMIPLTVVPLYLIEILHQTTTLLVEIGVTKGCILLKFYIKPQRLEAHLKAQEVVSY